jgi:hypothetical protein
MEQKLNLVVVEDIERDVESMACHLTRGGLNCELHRLETEAALLAALHTMTSSSAFLAPHLRVARTAKAN